MVDTRIAAAMPADAGTKMFGVREYSAMPFAVSLLLSSVTG